MHNPQRPYDRSFGAAAPAVDAGLRAHMGAIYKTMTVGMLVTAIAAWLISSLSISNGQLTDFGQTLFGTPLKWVVAFGPLGIILMMGLGGNRFSAGTLRTLFFAVAALIGVSMSTLLIAFTGASIATAFLATAAGFAGLSLLGYTTKRDLSGFGAFLIVGLIGLLVVMIVNIFVQSSALAFAVSVIGLLIFAGLTAYDTQRAKSDYFAMAGAGADIQHRAVTMAAMSLYLNFINIFQFLLSLIGVRNE